MIGIVGLLLFLLAYTIYVYFFPASKLSVDNQKWRWIASRLFFWLLLGALALYTRKIEHTSICNIEQKKYRWWFYILATMSIFLIVFIGSGVMILVSKSIQKKQISDSLQTMKTMFIKYPSLGLLTAVTAGVTEEFFFRGYLQNRLTLLSNKYVGIIVSAILFGLLHYNYGTLIQVLFPFWLGIVFSIFYDRYRNIYLLVFIHFLWDAIVLYNLTHFKIPLQ
ncbi:MAG: hypothetical protein DI598_19070 [Pseudopedobacter saltans]|uniref:CAAX prenyl protease 2/Lysostaphin resistance protein A-like domain-containing protein n=1 Tax=Pseudopedobacter saltans TaxID=151895 RepID=A0A2W5ECS6_9SPHI|nr:MAG: hypothetical protein DI598_19070 [Pseudopedobacter saltans]